jgi:hypothetical protein
MVPHGEAHVTWQEYVLKEDARLTEEALAPVVAEFDALRSANRSAMWAIYGLFAVLVAVAVLFPYGRFSPTLLNSGLPEAILGVALAVFNLIAPQLLAEATRTMDNERVYALVGRYFSAQGLALLNAQIAVSADTYRLIIALISAAGLLALAVRKFVA